MPKFLQDVFVPKNPDKYVGNRAPYYRSSWELTFMAMCDENVNVVKWASEPLRIPYLNPITNEASMYVPDFLIEYIDKQGKRHVELIEVKPLKQTLVSEAKSKHDKISLAINAQKWKAAAAFCEKRGIKLRILNEGDIFHNYKSKRK